MNRKYEEVKCIWVDSGIIDYKLCDKNFDCENCELDKVLRKTAIMNTEIAENAGKANNILTTIAYEISSLNYEKHLIYLKNYLCLKNLFGDKYFLGLSPLLYNLFVNSNGCFNCYKNYNVSAGENVAELKGEWGSINIASPMPMKLLKQIPQTNGESDTTNWIGIVEVNSTDLEPVSISQNQFSENKNLIISFIKSKEKENLAAGNTMYDGGKKVNCLPEFLGTGEFKNFINQIINISK